MKIEDKIIEKKKEIQNYERILNDYRGRWYDMGRRHLAELNEQLKDLEKERGPDGPLLD